MSIMEWQSGLSVSDGQMDHQHQELVRLINELDALLRGGADQRTLEAAVSNLIEVTRTHFEVEEWRMHQSGYPGMKAHAEEHARLTMQVLDLQAKWLRGEAKVGPELMAMLMAWLTDHIRDWDKPFEGKLKP